MVGGAYYGGPRIQTYGLDADASAWMGLGTDMGGGPYEHTVYFSDTGTYGFLGFGTYNGTTYSEKMRITRTGNVGINTTNPVAKLDVNGTINIDGSSFYSVATSSITAPSDQGLVAYYGFDEGSGTSISDYTGRNNTTSTGLSYTNTAIRGTALGSFGSDSSYVTTPNSSDFDFGTGDFAISMWCRPNSSFTNSLNTLIEIGRYTAGILIRPHAST